MAGLGHLERKHMRGVLVNTGLFVLPNGELLGIGYQEVWARELETVGIAAQRAKRALEAKESSRWPRAEQHMAELLAGSCRLVVIADREGDIFEWLARPKPAGVERLVRARHNRVVVGQGKLLSEVAHQLPEVAEMDVDVRRADERPGRTAHLVVRAGPVQLARPKQLGKGAPAECWCVVAEEPAAPGDAKPIFWVLLLSWAVNSPEEAVQAVRWYALRWLVERFHYTLKSGCKVEALQPASTDRLYREVGMRSVVAAMVLRLTLAARTRPDAPCDILLDEMEWKALYCRAHETMTPPPIPPSLREAVRMIAKLAGFPGWKSAGDPGVKLIWQGLRRLSETVAMYRIAVNSGFGPA
ncbi:Transposase for transposon Tn5 [compost metagenome]